VTDDNCYLVVWPDDDDSHHVESGTLEDCYRTLTKCSGDGGFTTTNDDFTFEDVGDFGDGKIFSLYFNGVKSSQLAPGSLRLNRLTRSSRLRFAESRLRCRWGKHNHAHSGRRMTKPQCHEQQHKGS
jgi:hypothetical protein